MKKSKRHGFKNFQEAIERDCAPGHAPHNPRVIYHPVSGFAVKSKLSGLGDGFVVAIYNYEPYGTTRAEYNQAVRNIEQEGKR